jgi:thiosulfate/3-mercaptopyruvate sulfurtransferase
LGGVLRRSGVDHVTTVVSYGGDDNWFAAYAYWLLRYRGFDQVRLLSGGRKAWELEGLPLTAEVPAVVPTTLRIDGRERYRVGSPEPSTFHGRRR